MGTYYETDTHTSQEKRYIQIGVDETFLKLLNVVNLSLLSNIDKIGVMNNRKNNDKLRYLTG